mmetsp:Transcript_3629/g.8095  ORF Transcript_3629/g.8095 Transcript_3629/m.8095 type:complete len:216 (+) Transcript_3629:104-751(+)
MNLRSSRLLALLSLVIPKHEIRPLDTASATQLTMTTSSGTGKIDWKVRPTNLEDEEAVGKLLKSSYGTLLSQDYSDNVLEKALPLITTPRRELLTCGTWFVVEDPQTTTVVGCGGWTRENPMAKAEGAAPHLRHFATDPTALRRGVGRALWKRIWSEVSTAIGPNTPLEVISTITARPFYESIGFRVIQHMELPLADDCLFPSILMRRDATTSPS